MKEKHVHPGIRFAAAALILASCSGNRARPRSATVPVILPRVLRALPHDTTAFTQGLLLLRGNLYESTGLHGRSSIRVIDTANGRVVLSRPVPGVFAEGLAFAYGRLYQLTWQEGIALVYDTAGLRVIDTVRYTGEGWGLAAGPGWLVMSNGSGILSFRNDRLEVLREQAVSMSNRPVVNLNELEYARGRIYANVWYNDFIFVIDPATGSVTTVIDCRELVRLSGAKDDESVLNGIAFDAVKGTFYLTGKNWPVIFEVELPGGN